MLIDSKKLRKRINELCVDNKPNSYNLSNIIYELEKESKTILIPKKYETDYFDDEGVENSIKLDLAVRVFASMIDDMEGVTIKDFLQHLMYVYDLHQHKVIGI